MSTRRQPARWRWDSKAKLERHLYRGASLLARVSERSLDSWRWRLAGQPTWSIACATREQAERVARANIEGAS